MKSDGDNSLELPDLEHEVAEGDRLSILKALAALIAHELAGNRCDKCQMSYVKAGEISSLVLRLQKIYEEIEMLDATKRQVNNVNDEQKRRSIRDIRPDYLSVVGGNANSSDPDISQFGTKAAPRRQGGRKPRL